MRLKKRFSEKETYQFVKIYFKHEHLWNTKHLEYKSHQRRLVAYKTVINEFYQCTGIQLTLAELRIKIKNLKSTYWQEIRKIKERIDYIPAMKWFAVWRNYMESVDNYESLEESNRTDEDSPRAWALETMDNDSGDPFESNKANDYVMIIKPECDPTKESNLRNRRQKSFKRTSTDVSVSDINVTENTNSEATVRDDEFEIYGKFVASQLRSMDLQRALALQLEIQNLVSRARLAELSDPCNIDSVTS